MQPTDGSESRKNASTTKQHWVEAVLECVSDAAERERLIRKYDYDELVQACLTLGTLALTAKHEYQRAEKLQREVDQRDEINAEVARAVAKFPTWPTDPLHALAVLGEEFGELTKAMVQFTYEPHKTNVKEIRTEALQTAAMALRLYKSLHRYDYKPAPQHSQDPHG